jgi:uncharacterized Rossmann fold enzyme
MSEEPKTLREWCLEIDAPLLEKDLRQAADTIERLIRERDEARAELADLKRKITEDWVSVSGDMPGICTEAEARGFERGVQEAAKVALHAWRASGVGGKMYAAILALLEPDTLQKPEA